MANRGEVDPVLWAFGQRVRNARTELGVSQEELAARAGLDRTYVSGIERGLRNVSLKNIHRLDVALDLSPGHLVDAEPPSLT